LVSGVTVLCVLAFFVGTMFEKEKYRDFLKGFKTLRENSDRYSFINPLIGNITAPATDVGIFTDIKGDLISYLKDEINNGELDSYSLYFRDLNTGLWFSANEKEAFFPASLYKLPVALAAYKQGESDPSFFDKVFIYTKELDDANGGNALNSMSSLRVGEGYKVEELVRRMLADSDNGAKNLLLTSMDQKYLNKLFELVSLTDPLKSNNFSVSARKYALFLRVLYGSSYLNNEHSETMMAMLAKSDFKDGLVAGVPFFIKVAHKFGTYEVEETIEGEQKIHQLLHDCGVVYHPERPYILCVMTKGKDSDTLYKIISHVSQMVYLYQDSEQE
jgi:beta-lactamase class A